MIGYKFLINLLFLSSLASCQSQTNNKDNKQNEKNIDSAKAVSVKEKFTLPSELDEISGFTFLSNDNNIVYAIQDEAGIVYTYDLKNGSIVSQFEFGPDADYEEITTDGEYFYILQSNGSIFSFPIGMDVDQAKVKKFDSKNLGKGEYESLAYDSKTNSLSVLCKSCSIDKGESTLTGYRLNILEQGEVVLNGSFSIDLNAVNKLNSKEFKSLKPSALSKRNSNNQWYVLSSVDNIILILDESLNPLEIINFKKKQFEQPEGINFNNQDAMFISSERNKAHNAFIYQIRE